MKNSYTFLKLHPRPTIFVVLFLLIGSFTLAQMAERASQAPSSFFPDGSLVYAEAKDLEGLLKWWKESNVKADWEESANYERFQTSTLYLKLRDRTAKWGTGGKFSFTLDNLIQAAGTQSALALYDIGELKAIAATRLPFAEAKTAEIWLAKSRFQEKKSDDRTYYVEPGDGALAFAYADPFLIVATEESLLTRTLANLTNPAQTLEQSRKWQLAQKQEDSDVALFLDQEALQKNRHFQKYWIHRNVRDFASIQATRIDLKIESNAITEYRHFVKSGADVSSAELNVQQYLSPFKNFRHEILYMNAPVDSADAARRILKMINRLPEKDKTVSYPPAFSGASERATQAETRNILLEQIDEPLLEVKSETLLRADQEAELAKLISAAQPAAQVRLSYPLWDRQALFVRFPQTLILQVKNLAALNQQAFLGEILEHFLLLQSTQDQGGRWRSDSNGNFVLESLHPIYARLDAPWIVISNEESDFKQIIANLPQSPVPPAANYSEVNWKEGRWKYTRLMERLDHGAYEEDVPLFFSGNIASLLRVLDPIVASTVTRNPNHEVVRYELK